MLIHWLWFATRPNLSDQRKMRLLEVFADAEEVYWAGQEELSDVEELRLNERSALLDKDLTAAEKILNQCIDKGISVCTFADREYPYRLKHIFDPPMVLYYKGSLPDMNHVPVIAAVGTRKASAYGMQVARRMGYQIANCGAVLVSGMAKGNDAMAMEGALLAGGTVLGVLGCGVDVIYPVANKALFADVERCGCLLSEFPPETPPYSWNFPRRNRIMSGMSNGTVVIEAPLGSGSLITARDALEQGRDVYAIPGTAEMPGFAGSLELLREGATIVRDGWDVVGEYQHMYPNAVHPMTVQMPEESEATSRQKVAQKPILPMAEPKVDKRKEKKPIDKSGKQPYSDVMERINQLPENLRQIAELLTHERLVDEIIEETGLSAAKVSSALTYMHIKGIIRRLPGNRVALK